SLEDALESPVYVLCRNICALPTHDVSRERFLTLLSALNDENNKFAYHFLFYLKARTTRKPEPAETWSSHRPGSQRMVCQEYDPRAFRFLIPSIYRKVISRVIRVQFHIAYFYEGALLSPIVVILFSPSMWSVIARFFICWSAIWSQDRPSVDLLTPVLEMDCSDKRPGNQFTCALLKYWSQEHARDLAQLVSQHVCKQLSGGKKRKSSKNQPSVEQVLTHLNWLYKRYFFVVVHADLQYFAVFKQESLVKALEQVRVAAPEARKNRFKMLFSICDEKESRKRTTRMSRVTANRPSSPASSDESDEEDVALKPKQAKRRKKNGGSSVDSDSDD
ncbi:predicted protein, partial [Nematostella vectensis]